MTPWLSVRHGSAPLLVSLPHTGTTIPAEYEGRLVSPWRARKDADWWIDRLYGFAVDLGATVVHTAISRTVIDLVPETQVKVRADGTTYRLDVSLPHLYRALDGAGPG